MENEMTAREFIEKRCDVPASEERLHALTNYLTNSDYDTGTQYVAFPDASVNGLENNPNEPDSFLHYLQAHEVKVYCHECQYYGDEEEGKCSVGDGKPEECPKYAPACSQFTFTPA